MKPGDVCGKQDGGGEEVKKTNIMEIFMRKRSKGDYGTSYICVCVCTRATA